VVAILAARGVPGISSGQFFINGVDTRTRGVDLVGEYTLQTGTLGTFRFNAAYSYNKTKILSVAENPANLSNTILFGRQARADLVKATPRDKLVLNTDWTLGAFRSALRITRFGKYTETSASQTSTVDDRTFGAKWIADIDVAADVGKNLTVAVGANNLFDVYPDAIGVVQANTGAGQYGNFAPFGLSGGFYYGRVSVRF